MKKLLIVVATLAAFLSSCSKSEEEDLFPYTDYWVRVNVSLEKYSEQIQRLALFAQENIPVQRIVWPLKELGNYTDAYLEFDNGDTWKTYEWKEMPLSWNFYWSDTEESIEDMPVVSIRQNSDGYYVWTLDGQPIIHNGDPLGLDYIAYIEVNRENGLWNLYYHNDDYTVFNSKPLRKAARSGRPAVDCKLSQTLKDVSIHLFDGSKITLKKVYDNSASVIFEDRKVEEICILHWDKDGNLDLSENEAASVDSERNAFTGNTEIRFFDEFKYFSGIKYLCESAFSGCSKLEKIKLPDNLTNISNRSFSNTAIRELEIPHSVNVIDKDAFSESALTEIRFEARSVLEKLRISDCPSLAELHFEWGSQLKDMVISQCPSLISIQLPANVTYLHFSCENLETVTFEEGSKLEKIDNAFENVRNLKLFDASNCKQLKTIAGDTFKEFSHLTIKIGAKVPPRIDGEWYERPLPQFPSSDFRIFVPSSSLEAYKSAKGWSHYAEYIYPME